MSLSAIWALAKEYGGTLVLVIVVLSGLIEVVPIKINPLSALVKWFGKNINTNVVDQLTTVKKQQDKISERLEEHITMDDERNADAHRYRILRFNTELIRGLRHTEEEFNEILYNVKVYKAYCREHPNYENHRAELAMENIDRAYLKCSQDHDFL